MVKCVNRSIVNDWPDQLGNPPVREILPPPVEVDDVDQSLGERLKQLLKRLQDQDQQPEAREPWTLDAIHNPIGEMRRLTPGSRRISPRSQAEHQARKRLLG